MSGGLRLALAANVMGWNVDKIVSEGISRNPSVVSIVVIVRLVLADLHVLLPGQFLVSHSFHPERLTGGMCEHYRAVGRAICADGNQHADPHGVALRPSYLARILPLR